MYALILDDEVLIFDFVKHYGIHKLNETPLIGFSCILFLKDIVSFCSCRDSIFEIERYSDFLFELCLKFLKD